MTLLPDQLNDTLEDQGLAPLADGQKPRQPHIIDPEVTALVDLAARLQAAPPVQVDPTFARRLEGRLLAHNARLHRRPTRAGWHFPRLVNAHPALAFALSLVLLVMVLGTGMLVAAAQVADPTNPLYAIKSWEQQVRVSLDGSPADQAELDLQFARDRLTTLVDLTAPGHAGAYRQALAELDQRMNTAAQAINALPAGPDHDRLTGELATLRADARQTLYGLLLRLALPERLATTEELGRLGASVPHLTSVTITLPIHPNGQATISISGDGIQPGAVLLIDGRLVAANGAFQQDAYVFMETWNGNQHPHTVGLMNPDGTTAETTAITLQSSPGNGSGNGNGNGSGHGNGGGGSGSENGHSSFQAKNLPG